MLPTENVNSLGQWRDYGEGDSISPIPWHLGEWGEDIILPLPLSAPKVLTTVQIH